MEKYYISTAIAYTSGKPHIGNTYEIILADAIAISVANSYTYTGWDEYEKMLQDMIVAAVNEAIKGATDEMQNTMADFTGGLGDMAGLGNLTGLF